MQRLTFGEAFDAVNVPAVACDHSGDGGEVMGVNGAPQERDQEAALVLIANPCLVGGRSDFGGAQLDAELFGSLSQFREQLRVGGTFDEDAQGRRLVD